VETLRLDRLPVVPTICLVLAAGILIPPSVNPDRRKDASRIASIAVQRLDRFARSTDPAEDHLPAVAPAGEVRTSRPAFYWPASPDAQRYALTVRANDGDVWIDDVRTSANFFVQAAPSELAPGGYRFEVRALNDAGRVVAEHEGAFTILTDTKLEERRRELGRKLMPPWEEALALARYHADKGSGHDVFSVLLGARAHAPGPLGESLEALGAEDAQFWLNRRLAHLQLAP